MVAIKKAAEATIKLRVCVTDRALIDQAARLKGLNRSQFVLASALRDAKNIILDRTSFVMDERTFYMILDTMDAPPTKEESAGVKRLLEANNPCADS